MTHFSWLVCPQIHLSLQVLGGVAALNETLTPAVRHWAMLSVVAVAAIPFVLTLL